MRVVAAAPLFALAFFFAIRGWNPLGNGYFRESKDSPDGVYLTIAGIGASIAALFATTGVVVASRWFRRHGGFLVIAAAAVVACTLPYLLFKWTTDSDSWAWAFFVQDWVAWLRFGPRSRSFGIAIQVALALIAVGAASAQIVVWGTRSAGSRSHNAGDALGS